ALPGGALGCGSAAHPRRRSHTGLPAHAGTGGSGRLALPGVLRLGRHTGPPAPGCGDDAAGAARADVRRWRRVLPLGSGVFSTLRAGRGSAVPAGRAHHRDAPRADEPRAGDLRRGGRLGPVHRGGAGRQRGGGPDGRALPAAGRYRRRESRVSTYLIQGAALYGQDRTDLLLAEGRIAATGEEAASAAPADAVHIDATDLVALPGLVDLHTHLRQPGREDAETVASGTRAAAAGGFTCVHAMANTTPTADTAGVVEQVWRLGADA